MYTVKLFDKPVADAIDALLKLNLRYWSPKWHCFERDPKGPSQIYSAGTLR